MNCIEFKKIIHWPLVDHPCLPLWHPPAMWYPISVEVQMLVSHSYGWEWEMMMRGQLEWTWKVFLWNRDAKGNVSRPESLTKKLSSCSEFLEFLKWRSRLWYRDQYHDSLVHKLLDFFPNGLLLFTTENINHSLLSRQSFYCRRKDLLATDVFMSSPPF